ncbi:MAG: diacylglycerol kinase [Actinobacteria bacterium 69-20]|jgi:diacylglycerol kinase family enzyme|nr:diacylglycerol kinase family lipid kinase [Actinomycetota bacterium]OJV24608.1 MAG: diacylglycerol kinase [Actinobacteria bacterium 69-20]
MRALLIVNPHATATTERRRDLLSRALAGSMKLHIAHTEHRGHATELAAAALTDGTRLVVVHGGDGTVNEVVNGLLSRGVTAKGPLLAVVPGGSTNVFARAVGIDPDPTAATEQILEGLARGRTRVVSLGLADDRYFTFNAGLGLDAEVVKAVEEHRAGGRSISNSLHIRRAISTFFATDRAHPRLTVTADGAVIDHVHVALVSNVDPWTYAGRRPVRTNPGLPADRGLGLLAMRSLHTATVLRVLWQLVMRGGGPASKHLVRVDDAVEIAVRADAPVALQVDGDYLGDRTSVTFTSVPRALRVVV